MIAELGCILPVGTAAVIVRSDVAVIPADTVRLVCPRDEFDSVPSDDRMRDMAETTAVTITILGIERVEKGDVGRTG
jgi:hypothetical protein